MQKLINDYGEEREDITFTYETVPLGVSIHWRNRIVTAMREEDWDEAAGYNGMTGFKLAKRFTERHLIADKEGRFDIYTADYDEDNWMLFQTQRPSGMDQKEDDQQEMNYEYIRMASEPQEEEQDSPSESEEDSAMDKIVRRRTTTRGEPPAAQRSPSPSPAPSTSSSTQNAGQDLPPPVIMRKERKSLYRRREQGTGRRATENDGHSTRSGSPSRSRSRSRDRTAAPPKDPRERRRGMEGTNDNDPQSQSSGSESEGPTSITTPAEAQHPLIGTTFTSTYETGRVMMRERERGSKGGGKGTGKVRKEMVEKKDEEEEDESK